MEERCYDYYEHFCFDIYAQVCQEWRREDCANTKWTVYATRPGVAGDINYPPHHFSSEEEAVAWCEEYDIPILGDDEDFVDLDLRLRQAESLHKARCSVYALNRESRQELREMLDHIDQKEEA